MTYIRQRYTRPDKSGLANFARWRALIERYRRRMKRRGLVGRWALLREDWLQFWLSRSAVLRDVYSWAAERRAQRKYFARLAKLETEARIRAWMLAAKPEGWTAAQELEALRRELEAIRQKQD